MGLSWSTIDCPTESRGPTWKDMIIEAPLELVRLLVEEGRNVSKFCNRTNVTGRIAPDGRVDI